MPITDKKLVPIVVLFVAVLYLIVNICGRSVCGMLEYIGYSSSFGSYEARVRSDMECAALCYRDATCKAADYDKTTRFCRMHRSSGYRKEDDHSIRFEKSCSVGGRYLAPALGRS